MLPFHPFLPHPSVDHASLQPIMDPPVRSGTGDSAAFFGNDNALSRRPKVPCGTQRQHLRLILSPKGAVRHSKATLTAYSVAQRCRATLKGGTYGLFCRPKVPCDTQRRHLRGLFVAREHSDKLSREQNAPFRSRERLGRLSREQNAPFRSRDALVDPSVSRTRCFAHETTSADPSVSRMRLFAHETTSEDPSVSRTRRLAHETSSEDPPVSRTRLFAHETISEGPPVSRTRLFTHETAAKDTRGNRGAFSASYGNSTGTLRALLNAAEVRPEPVRLIERLGAFRDGDLDG